MGERGQIKGGDDMGRGEKAEAVHALLKGLERFGGAEEVAEDVGGRIDLEGLGPTVRAFADGIREVGPEVPEDVAGVEDIAGEGLRTRPSAVALGVGGVAIAAIGFREQAEIDAGVEEEFGGSQVGGDAVGDGGGGVAGRQQIKDAEVDGGEHHLRTAEGFDEIKNGVHGSGPSRGAGGANLDRRRIRDGIRRWFRWEMRPGWVFGR